MDKIQGYIADAISESQEMLVSPSIAGKQQELGLISGETVYQMQEESKQSSPPSP